MSIFAVLIIASFSIYFSYLTFSRQNVKVNINEESNPVPTPIKLSEYPFILIIYNSTGSLICDFEPMINVRMGWYELNKTSDNLMVSEKKLIKNTNLSFNDSSLSPQLLECGIILDPNDPENQNLTLYGPFGSPSGFTDFVLYINRCVNTTENGNFCKSDEEISNFTQDLNINLELYSYSFDNQNFTNPGKKNLSPNLFHITSSIYRQITLKYEEVQYYTDVGFVFQDYREDKYFEIAKPVIDYDIGEENTIFPRNFARIVMYHNSKVKKNYRVYSKIQDLVANVGGLIKSILMISMFIDHYFVKPLYINALANYLILGHQLSPDKTCISGLQTENLKTLKTNNFLLTRDKIHNTNILNRNESLPINAKEEILNKWKNLNLKKKIGIRQIAFRCCCKGSSVKRIDLVRNFINGQSSIEYIIKQLINLKKLERILLTENEISMMKYIPNNVRKEDDFQQNIKENYNHEELGMFLNKNDKTDLENKILQFL